MVQDAARRHRAWERAQREAERQSRASERDRARAHVESRIAETEEQNQDLEENITALGSVLAEALRVDPRLDYEALKEKPSIPRFNPGGLDVEEPLQAISVELPKGLGFFQRLWPPAKRRHAEAVAKAHADAQQRHETYMAERVAREELRKRRLAEAQHRHEAEVAAIRRKVEERNHEIDRFREDVAQAHREAIETYCGLVLERGEYPKGFPQKSKVAYVPESKQLVVEYDLPPFDIVPGVAAYRYVKASDDIAETPRSPSQRKQLYSSIVAQTTLRTLYEVFTSDVAGHVESIVLNGHVDTIDKGTGHNVRPCLVTLRTTRERFTALDLSRVDPIECLKGLNASLSKSPAELLPVRPVLEFNMVDPRFVKEADVLSTLDQRPNLMALAPKDFESLITNLFARMGLETRLTQPSRDGGVDCVAYDQRPIFGGKVVIQAKRYKHTVGVSAVRDLFGTVQNEGASKGILVTTSGYGKASFDFAEGKPLELLSGSHLLHLLAEHAGIEAKIEVPDDWKDPAPDASDVDA